MFFLMYYCTLKHQSKILMKNFRALFIIFFLFSSFIINAQKGIIRGKITDAKTNEPVISANVIITNTTNGVVSDLDGVFELINPKF